jgi:hypothetical protein
MSDLLHSRLSRRAGIGLVAAALATTATSRAFAEDGGTDEKSTPAAASTSCSCGSTYNTQTVAQAASPEASPVASAISSEDLPEGALGDRIVWLLDLINGDVANITGDAIAPEFTDEVLAEAPADMLAAVIADISRQAAPLMVQPGQVATTPGTPPTTAVFRAEGREGVVVQITIGIEPESGLIGGLIFKPLGFTLEEPVATPAS